MIYLLLLRCPRLDLAFFIHSWASLFLNIYFGTISILPTRWRLHYRMENKSDKRLSSTTLPVFQLVWLHSLGFIRCKVQLRRISTRRLEDGISLLRTLWTASFWILDGTNDAPSTTTSPCGWSGRSTTSCASTKECHEHNNYYYWNLLCLPINFCGNY